MRKTPLVATLIAALLCASPTPAETYRGLTIAPEHRCTPYPPNDYPYPQSVEAQIVATLDGAIYGPYSGTYFRSTRDTDIEHIVARSEAHDNRNGRITCAEARRHGIAPVPRGHPAYRWMRDGDGDGMVCE